MTTLPDLEPDQLGYIAFWNIIEQGGMPKSELDWSDVLSNGNVISHDLYDNGYEINYDDPAWETMTLRLKTDGWVIAYSEVGVDYDGTNAENTSGSGQIDEDNPPNILNNLTQWWKKATDTAHGSYSDPDTLEINRFERAIATARNALSNGGVATYNSEDVGFYDFVHNAEAHTILGRSGHSSDNSMSMDISALPNTVLHAIHAAGSLYTNDNPGYGDVDVNIAGTHVHGDGNAESHYTYDITPFVEVDSTTTIKHIHNDSSSSSLSVMAAWSEE